MQKHDPGNEFYWGQVREAAAYVENHLAGSAATAVATGTGLSESLMQMAAQGAIDYRQIPHFPVSTVESHTGRIVFGRLNDCPVLVLQGRFHLYEGYSARRVAFPVRVLQALGVKNLILTNAAGGLCPDFAAGDLMAICDHINLTGENPLVGANSENWGLRFPDMSAVYDPDLMAGAAAAARKAGIDLQKGVYAGLKGPSLETPAELRFIRQIGADAVGLSTVMEVIAAVHAQMRVCGISIITNIADPDHPAPATLEAIIRAAQQAAPKLGELIFHLVREI